MNVLKRHNVNVTGPHDRTAIVFAHGFGCDQNMWRYVAPQFAHDHQVVLFDYIGAGGSDLSHYHPSRYSTLAAYADDVLAIVRELDFKHSIFVGHSVSAMIGVLATIKEPERFDKLVLICPSPRYINDGEYVGGFEASDIEALLESLESNYLGWSSTMAPVIMGNADRPELSQDLSNSFCRMDPTIAENFARVTFLSDNRRDLPHVRAKTLILQCSADVIAPLEVGHFVQNRIPNSKLVVMNATGHCPNLSAPYETVGEIKRFLNPV
ncbi:MAG: alpha/beta hydrolase [Nitrospirota bacterium]